MLMTYITMKNIIVCLILFANIFQSNAALEKRKCFLSSKFQVRVANNLPPYTEPIYLHCASGDDDLGRHKLERNQEFHWSFCERVIGTLFFCHLWWGSKEKAFDAFSGKWKGRCDSGTCSWIAKSDGIYFAKDSSKNSLAKMFNWEVSRASN
ncbi:hypothetical protein DH2020_030742 [Rehmannia glutinosa]|uniref:S-protein homolog n=1 Tax=Rehmannia glutinosa TaxID=99300 RepID=A0ABR0VLQ3_REHGL